jgi:hypothetical protein
MDRNSENSRVRVARRGGPWRRSIAPGRSRARGTGSRDAAATSAALIRSTSSAAGRGQRCRPVVATSRQARDRTVPTFGSCSSSSARTRVCANSRQEVRRYLTTISTLPAADLTRSSGTDGRSLGDAAAMMPGHLIACRRKTEFRFTNGDVIGPRARQLMHGSHGYHLRRSARSPSADAASRSGGHSSALVRRSPSI